MQGPSPVIVVKRNQTSAKDVSAKGQDRSKAFIELRKRLTEEGLHNYPNVSARTIYQNLNGFRFDQQSSQGTRRHYALQENGGKGKTNILTITIDNISDQIEEKAILDKLNSFPAKEFIQGKICCFDFSKQ